jgi:hypothetical protein
LLLRSCLLVIAATVSAAAAVIAVEAAAVIIAVISMNILVAMRIPTTGVETAMATGIGRDNKKYVRRR